jgi:hypothetical protein
MSFDEIAWNDAVRWGWRTARDGLKARAALAACLAALMVVSTTGVALEHLSPY